MRNLVLAALLSAALALAGCSGGDGGPKYEAVTCPDGTVLTPEQVEDAMENHSMGGHDHGADGGNGTESIAGQVCPVPPSVTLEGVPATIEAFKSAPYRWSLHKGSLEHAHSMLTSIRWSDRTVPDRDLTNLNKYPNELIKREHQDLPISYEGNLTFAKVGKVYLRAYAQIQGADHWSPEVELTVLPVPPTGTVHDVTHGPGDFLSPPTPSEVAAVLGDAVRLVNEDPLAARTCSFSSGPAAVNPLSAPAGGASEPVVLVVPGVYQFTCDEVGGAQSFSVNVAMG
jgi:hypothetical protein